MPSMCGTDEFNLITGLIFDAALSAFPNQIWIDERSIVKQLWNQELPIPEYDPISGAPCSSLSPEQEAHLNTIRATKAWLIEEGFLRARPAPSIVEKPVVLTAKSLSLLDNTPSVLSENSFANELRMQVREGAWEAVKSTVTKIIVASISMGQ